MRTVSMTVSTVASMALMAGLLSAQSQPAMNFASKELKAEVEPLVAKVKAFIEKNPDQLPLDFMTPDFKATMQEFDKTIKRNGQLFKDVNEALLAKKMDSMPWPADMMRELTWYKPLGKAKLEDIVYFQMGDWVVVDKPPGLYLRKANGKWQMDSEPGDSPKAYLAIQQAWTKVLEGLETGIKDGSIVRENLPKKAQALVADVVQPAKQRAEKEYKDRLNAFYAPSSGPASAPASRPAK